MKQKNVLIVDNDKCLYDIISRILKKSENVLENINFHYARNLQTAKNIISEKKIDLIFTDYVLKGFTETGEDVINWINEKKYKTKVIVTTPITDSELHSKLKEKGASCVMRKPFNSKSLITNYINNIGE